MAQLSLPTAKTRVTAALLIGTAAALAAGASGHWPLAPLVGWDAAAAGYIAWVWLSLWPLTPSQTAAHAAREDPSRPAADLLLLSASVASLAAVGFLIVSAAGQSGATKAWLVGLGIFSVVASWSLVHTVFALRYARLYYAKTRGNGSGVDFNELDGPPAYADFAYLAFTIGMTFQVSDTALKTKPFRATALRHALLSYVFGTVIVATTINFIAGLGK